MNLKYWLTLALLPFAAASGAAPSYSAAGIVNAGNSAAGPFAPNSILTIYGTDLARSEYKLSADDIRAGYLPTELNYTRVYVDNIPAPLLYVSPGQINFVVPADQSTGKAKIRVVRESWTGPDTPVDIVDAAPALFLMQGGYAIATHADNSLITADASAHSGEIIVLYLTGMGQTDPKMEPGEIPRTAAQIQHLADLKVSLGGLVLDPVLIKYAGATPGCAGLYQINLFVPDGTGTNPEIRISIKDQATPAGAKLYLH